VGQALQAAGLLPLPETLGGAGALPADYKSAPHASGTPLPSSPSGMSNGRSSPAILPAAALDDDDAATVARDVSSGVGSLIHAPLPVAGTGSGSIVQPVATPPRRGAAVGIGAMIGGGIFMVVLAGVVTWVAVTRNNAEPSTAAPPPEASVVSAVPSAAPPRTPEPSAAPPAPSATETAVTVDSLPSAKPAKTARPAPVRPVKPRPVTTSKPKGGEFQPDRL
jgi:hypothetical protein